MSTLKDPVGPKDRSVYVRRRLIVLLCLLAVIVAIVLIILRPGSHSNVANPDTVEVPKDIAGTTATTDSKDSSNGSDVPECAAGQFTVTPATDKGDYAAGEDPKLSLSVENTGDEACSADLGSANLTFVIASGDDEVWRSGDCQKNAEHLAVILEPKKPLKTDAITWDRTRSSPETCDITRDAVAAGGASYHLRTTAAGVQGTGTAQFLLY